MIHNIVIDDSLMTFHGRLSFIYFSTTKRTCFSMKYYKICHSGSGHCIQFRISSGQKVGDLSLPAHVAVGVDGFLPIHRLKHIGYMCIYIYIYIYIYRERERERENWYLSPAVFEKLLRGRHECFGDSKVQWEEFA